MTKQVMALAACAAWFLGGVLQPAGAGAADEGGAAALNTLSPQEQAGGWKLLFDGKTTDGWRGYGKKTIPAGWKVVDGALCRVTASGDIVTVEKYANFELVLDWKIAPGGNSGILYRVSEDTPAPYWTGPEYQLLDDAHHRVRWDDLSATGSAYAIYPPTKDACKPVGQWNTAKIVCNGKHVEHWLNGQQIVSYEFGSEDWNGRVQKSKFKAWPKYGKNASGYIDLQDHGGRMEFRNIKIHVLP